MENESRFIGGVVLLINLCLVIMSARVCGAWIYCLSIRIGSRQSASMIIYYTYYFVASSDSRRNIGGTATPKRAHSISWRHRHQQLIGALVCVQVEYILDPSRQRCTLIVEMLLAPHRVGWMENFFNYNSPTDTFYFAMCTFERVNTNTTNINYSRLERLRARWTQAMEIVVHMYILFMTPRAKYTHYGLLMIELSWVSSWVEDEWARVRAKPYFYASNYETIFLIFL